MERGFTFAEDEYYHIYSRGVDRRHIFVDKKDEAHFLKLMYLCNSTERIELRDLPHGESVYNHVKENTLVDVGCYCLMPNHIHLLLHEHTEGGITKFMSKLLTAYVKYFNKKSDRTGSLFDGRFRARHVDEDGYFHYLYAYIHLNPIKIIEPKWKEEGIRNTTRAETFLDSYSSSSYRDYIGVVRPEAAILTRDPFPEYFKHKGDFKDFLKSWMSLSDEYV